MPRREFVDPPSFGQIRRVSVLASCPRLMEGGEPNPEWSWSNIADFGYASPKRQYIESVDVPGFTELARLWGLDLMVLRSWVASQNWKSARAVWWGRIEEIRQGRTQEAIAAIRDREIVERQGFWTRVRQVVEAKLAQGTETEYVGKEGREVERKFSAKDLRDIAAAGQIVEDRLDTCFGWSKQMLRDAEKLVDGESGAPVRKLRFNLTVTEEVSEELPEHRKVEELPEGRTVEAPFELSTKEVSRVDSEIRVGAQV